MYRFYCFRKNYAPFAESEFFPRLQAHGFLPGSPWNSEVVFTRNLKKAQLATLLFPSKKVIVWTHEPRFCQHAKPFARGPLGKHIFVFNVFSGNVFWHNHHFLGSYHYNEFKDLGTSYRTLLPLSSLPSHAEWENRKQAIAVFGKRPVAPYLVAGNNTDLLKKRQAIALKGKERGLCDIVGKNWPEGCAIESSGFADNDATAPWWVRKIELMKGYKFNIALENTLQPYYVTEKIWQSIKAVCLPIYYGKGGSISEIFPPNSFVDAGDFQEPDALWRFLSQMTYDEWYSRMELCTTIYNQEIQFLSQNNHSHFDEVIEQVKSVLSQSD